MEASELIQKIDKAVKIEDIFPNVRHGVGDRKVVLSLIHPDRCKIGGAEEAFKKVNEMIQEWKSGGKIYIDESGNFKFNGYWAKYEGNLNKDIFNWSYENYVKIKEKYPDHLKNYLPQSIDHEIDSVVVQLKDRGVLASGLELSQEHVNWILSRLLEFCVMLHDGGKVHAGLNPENVFIIPETHGIVVGNFYHLSEKGKKVGTINGKYKDWYPPELFRDKIATERIDIELVKKVAIYLLGDKSGVGTKLRGRVNNSFLNFVLKGHSNSLEAYKEYRDMLSKNFEKKFHILNI